MLEIMLIEDDLVDAMSIQRMFKKNRIKNPLHFVENALKALEVLEAQALKILEAQALVESQNRQILIIKERWLILLDYYMPKMNGLEFLTHLQTKPDFQEIPVIIFTTFQESQAAMKKCHLNIIGNLIKPVAFSEFTKILKFDVQTQQLSI